MSKLHKNSRFLFDRNLQYLTRRNGQIQNKFIVSGPNSIDFYRQIEYGFVIYGLGEAMSMEFIGRSDEKKYIMEAAKAGEVSILVVYGRI